MDATDDASLFGAVETAERAFGPVDILVNNAGIPDAQRAHRMPVELGRPGARDQRSRALAAQLRVARRLIAANLPGRIVNISSVAHYRYDGGGAALYAVTKTAIARMTEALAVEWAVYRINVNAIAPGMFVSEMTTGCSNRSGRRTRTSPVSASVIPRCLIRRCFIWLRPRPRQ